MRFSVLAVWLFGAALLAGCQQPFPTEGGNASGHAAGGGQKIRIALMPKKTGIEYFNICNRGAQEAARELGDVEVVYEGTTSDSSEEQSRLLDNWRLSRRFDAILVACNDPDQIAPAIKRARDAGIHVLTYDADANPQTSGREFFVNQCSNRAVAETLIDEMVKQVGENAEVAIVTSRLTAPNQNAWIREMRIYQRQKYPGLTLLDPRPSEEDQNRAITEAQNLLKTRPNVKGIFGLSSVAFPGVAHAVQQQGKSGQVAVVGLSSPRTMRKYVEDGTVKTVILWNVPDLGYLAVHAARAVVKGELRPGATSFTAGRLKEVAIEGDQILLGRPMRFDKGNIAQYDF